VTATATRVRLARLALGLLLCLTVTASQAPATTSPPLATVIVEHLPGTESQLVDFIRRFAGTVVRDLAIVDTVVARVPAQAVAPLRAAPGVLAVTPDTRVQLAHSVDGYDGGSDDGSAYFSGQVVMRSRTLLKSGITGRGVDVALIDSGIAPVNGLAGADKVVNGADVSFEASADNLRYLDSFGHGTHMAGLIAGRDSGVLSYVDNHDDFLGVAPDARIVNVKVADAHGATDVSQVLAAIDWVVQHRKDNGLNIRVLNLSFGTDGTQDYRLDPLAAAVEIAWRHGIVVVVAAGNGGPGTALTNPASDPYVIAVGASDPKGTSPFSDDTVASFSSTGTNARRPDIVAPGVSLQSLRAPNSTIDLDYPGGRINERFFRGSGTSQATALVSGAVALLLDQRPDATPDQIKQLLIDSASPLPSADRPGQGAGAVNLDTADLFDTPTVKQTWTQSSGTGTLEGARGSSHLVMDGVVLEGEVDIFGNAFDSAAWTQASAGATAWNAGTWNGVAWTGDSWTTDAEGRNSWSGVAWTRNSWSRDSWSSDDWSRNSWSRNSWSRDSWSADEWVGSGATSDNFTRNSWSAESWS
jgi:subtilisin family serine protease